MWRYTLAVFLLSVTSACSLSDGSVPVRRASATAVGTLLVDFSRRPDSGEYRRPTARYGFDGDSTDAILIEGFGSPERGEHSEFAWATAVRARLRLRVLDTSGHRWLHLTARPFVSRARTRQTMTVSLNDTVIGTVTLSSRFFADYSLAVPGNTLRVGDNNITFDFSYAESPSRTSSAADSRALAAAFDHLEITTRPEPPDAAQGDSVAVDTFPPAETGRLVLPSNAEVVFPIQVPASGVLAFELERRTDDADSPIRGELMLTPLGPHRSEEVFFSERADGGPWQADLSAWAGETVGLTFRAIGGTPNDAVVWAAPRLYGDVGEMNVSSNVVLIVIDTLRADYLGAYGGAVDTPHLDQLAATAVRFERAYSHAPITVPSHASMLTSQLPTEHGALNNDSMLSRSHTTLTELMRDAYRATAAFVSLGVLQRRSGIDQGFDRYADTFDADWWKSADEMNRQLVPWLEEDRAAPFFLFAHYSDPHEPYAAPGRSYPAVEASIDGRVVAELIADGTMAVLELELPPGRSALRLTAGPGHAGQQLRLNNLGARNQGTAVTCTNGCRERSPGPGIVEFVTRLPASIVIERAGDHSGTERIHIQMSEDLSHERARVRYREEVEYLDAACVRCQVRARHLLGAVL